MCICLAVGSKPDVFGVWIRAVHGNPDSQFQKVGGTPHYIGHTLFLPALWIWIRIRTQNLSQDPDPEKSFRIRNEFELKLL
jgi:hypothetical protein